MNCIINVIGKYNRSHRNVCIECMWSKNECKYLLQFSVRFVSEEQSKYKPKCEELSCIICSTNLHLLYFSPISYPMIPSGYSQNENKLKT